MRTFFSQDPAADCIASQLSHLRTSAHLVLIGTRLIELEPVRAEHILMAGVFVGNLREDAI
jgi:hypothetical protein